MYTGVFLGMWTHIYVKVNLHMYTPCKYTPAQTSIHTCIYMYVFYTYMYFLSCERAANIHTYANVLFQVKLAVRIKYFYVKSKKYFNHSHLKTNTALRINFHAHYVFTKILIFIYNNAQIHPNLTVQSFCLESMKTVRSYFGFQQKSVVFSN